jgi:hypothetical protein
MIPVLDEQQVRRWRELVSPLVKDERDAGDFSEKWITENGWVAVPVEDVGHFNPEQRAKLASALSQHGVKRCVAIATEPLGDRASCFELQPTEAELDLFNQECGLFRFMLTDEGRTWAISCNEWYNVFAGKPELLEAMLGKPISTARKEFLSFASTLAKTPDEPLLQVAKRYEVL